MRPVTTVRLRASHASEPWADALARFDPDGTDTRVLKRYATPRAERAVCRARLLDREVVVKSWTPMRASSSIKVVLGLAPPARQWRGWCFLHARGLNPLAPIGHFRRGRTHLLVLPYADGPTLLQALAGGMLDDDAPGRDAIARAVGEQLGALDRLGRRHRDHKPSNLVVLPGPRIQVIDAEGLRPGADLPGMLAALAIEPMGTGLDLPEPFLRAVAKASDPDGADRLLDRARARVGLHLTRHGGDVAPRHDPLKAEPPGSESR